MLCFQPLTSIMNKEIINSHSPIISMKETIKNKEDPKNIRNTQFPQTMLA